MTSLTLPSRLERTLAAGHPWVYRDHVPADFRAPSGTWVRVKAGRWSGYALWDEASQIALRVFSHRGIPDATWIEERVRSAYELREPLRAGGVTAYRWLNGEGDGLPGITVDLYESFAVLVTYADAVEPLVDAVATALEQTTGLAGVLRRRGPHNIETLRGRAPPRDLVVLEHGMRLRADLQAGQKTGLYLDHRENRRLVRGLSSGRRVLNLFSYTGAFSISALLGGAAFVTSVDAAEPAATAAAENVRLNGLDADASEVVVGDVFEVLGNLVNAKRRFDLVICDPPSFARGKDQRESATRAYVRLHTRALELVALDAAATGGLYCAASCTAQVAPEAFREVIAEAAARAQRRFQIIHEAGQALDHPVLAAHPEGRYLKFIVGRVLPLQ